MTPLLLKPSEAAGILGCHIKTLRKLRVEGAVQAVRVPGMKQWRYRREDILRISRGTP